MGLRPFVGQEGDEATFANKCSLYISNDLAVCGESGLKTLFCTCRQEEWQQAAKVFLGWSVRSLAASVNEWV